MRPSLEVELVSGDLEERKERMTMAAQKARPTLMVKHKAQQMSMYVKKGGPDRKEMMKQA